MPDRPHKVWFLASPAVELLDIAGPWSVLGHCNTVLERRAYVPELLTPKAATITTSHGLQLAGARALSFRRNLPDLVVVPGGLPTTKPTPEYREVVRWLARFGERVPLVASICTGAFVLAEAGLLNGRRAMTHWGFVGEFERRFAEVELVRQGIYVRDGHVWSSAGVSAGIDLTLALVEEHHGYDVAMAVARRLVLFLRRSGDQAQFSETLRRQGQEPERLSGLSAFILEHLDEALTVERLAGEVGMSPRTLCRWCQRHWGLSPADLVRRQRVNEAQRMLRNGHRSLEEIAVHTGLGDVSTLRRSFQRLLGISPSAYRERFALRSAQNQPT